MGEAVDHLQNLGLPIAECLFEVGKPVPHVGAQLLPEFASGPLPSPVRGRFPSMGSSRIVCQNMPAASSEAYVHTTGSRSGC